MISNGNPKPYSSIWNIYEACDTCNRFEALEVTSKSLESGKLLMSTKNRKRNIFRELSTVIELLNWIVQAMSRNVLAKPYMIFRSTPKLEHGKPLLFFFFYLEYQTQLLSIPFFLIVIFCHLNPYTVTLAVEHVTFFMITSMQYIYNTFFILFVLKLFYISMYVF